MSDAEAAPDPKPSRASGLLSLVRQLIDYGRQIATTFRANPHPFGAGDIALILAHITRGLLRAVALEARIIRNAVHLDAEPVPPRAASQRQSPPARSATAHPTDTDTAAAGETLVPGLDPGICLPTLDRIAAEVRRRPIGAVIADICRDLGIKPNHPLWRELSVVIIRYGGNLARLVKDICDLAFQKSRLALATQLIARAGPATPGTFRHRPALIPGVRTAAYHARGRLRPAPPFRSSPAATTAPAGRTAPPCR